MQRPRLVGDAIFLQDDGWSVGQYGWYTLHTAYQPIFSLEGAQTRIYGAEGLARPRLDDFALPPPAFFSAIPKKDQIFVDMLCRALQFRNFRHIKGDYPHLFINLDTQIYSDPDEMVYQFGVMIEKMAGIGIDPAKIVCEITETRESSSEMLRRIVENLRTPGIRVAVDDFGAAFSNLKRVLDVGPDIVKLDRVWANALLAHEPKALERTIGEFLDTSISVLYEGVETQEQLAFAENNGCSLAQGFLLARPFIPTSQTEAETLAGPEAAGLDKAG